MLAPLSQDAVEATAHGLGLNLLGVAGADRRQPIGKHHAGFQQIEFTVKLHLMQVEVFPIEAR